MIHASSPRASYLGHQEEIDAAIARVLAQGRYILGEEVSAFEQEFADYIGVRYAVGVGSGTEALHIALAACGIGPGDQVLTVSLTAGATVAAVELAGGQPAFVDINPATYTMDPDRVAAAIDGKVKAIVPVHLYGHPADLAPLLEVSREYGLQVVEDCAQAHGALYRGRRLGGWGTAAAFSFYPTKNLGAVGDAGMVVTDDWEVADRARLIREYGWRQRYVSEMPGLNSRLDELQAAVLRVKLRYLEEENERRRALAALYLAQLTSTRLVLPQEWPSAKHVYHQFVVRSRQRDALRAHLQSHGVETLIHYPVPVHLQPAYRGRVHASTPLPATEQACAEILSLPMHPYLAELEIEFVSTLIARWERES